MYAKLQIQLEQYCLCCLKFVYSFTLQIDILSARILKNSLYQNKLIRLFIDERSALLSIFFA